MSYYSAGVEIHPQIGGEQPSRRGVRLERNVGSHVNASRILRALLGHVSLYGGLSGAQKSCHAFQEQEDDRRKVPGPTFPLYPTGHRTKGI